MELEKLVWKSILLSYGINENLMRVLRISEPRSRSKLSKSFLRASSWFAFVEFNRVDSVPLKGWLPKFLAYTSHPRRTRPHLFAAIAFRRCVLPASCIGRIIAFLKLLPVSSFVSRGQLPLLRTRANGNRHLASGKIARTKIRTELKGIWLFWRKEDVMYRPRIFVH